MKLSVIAIVCVAAVPALAGGSAEAQTHHDRVVVTHRTVTRQVSQRPVYRRPIAHRTQHCGYRWMNHHRVRRCWYG